MKRARDWFSSRSGYVDFVDRPFQGQTLKVSDNVGVPIEICPTMEHSSNRMRCFRAHQGGKLAFLDHVQFAAHDVQAAYEWYSEIGFRLTEYTAAEGTDELWGVWLKR